MAFPLTALPAVTLAEADRLLESGQETAALALLDQLRKREAHPAVYRKMAEIFQKLGMAEASATVLAEGAARFPEDEALQGALAQHYYRSNEIEKGLQLTTPLVQGQEAAADILLTHAALLKATNRSDEARQIYEDLLKKNPADATALSSLAGIFSEQGNEEKAEAHYRKALAAAPGHTHISIQFATFLLRRGRLAEGFELYKSRFGKDEGDEHAISRRRPFGQSLWDGKRLSGTVLIWNEQGVGEEILYASMYGDAKALVDIRVECDARLVPLFERSFKGIRFIARTTPPAEATQNIQAQIPAGHLGALFRRSFEAFPKTPSYLVADTAKAAALRQLYSKQLKLGGKIIGVSWRSQKLRHGDPKSTSIADWAPVMESSPHLFVSLQYGEDGADIAAAQMRGWALIEDKEIDQQKSLDDFAVQIAAMDGIITVSNTTAHMAGALGKKTAVLLPRSKGLMWHWFETGENSPWYPSLQLLRQEKDGDWSGALICARDFVDSI